jgi:hypothetical protein
VVGEPLVEQTLDRLVVTRAVAALVEDWSVPLEAVRLQRADNRISRAFALSWRIDVLDAKQPTTSAGSCLKVARDCRDQRAEVKGTGG